MRFIVDNNVGRLAPWLRALGYDAMFINPVDDDQLLEIARREGRVVLTKDTGILHRRLITSGEIESVRIEGDDWRDQLAQVVTTLSLQREPSFTRCLECNALLESRSREEARRHVPAYVHRTQEAFLTCPVCGRYFWRGTHWQRMQRELAGLL